MKKILLIGPESSEVATVLGMPAWVFYSVLLPWLVSSSVSIPWSFLEQSKRFKSFGI